MMIEEKKAYELNADLEDRLKLVIDIILGNFMSSIILINEKFGSAVFGKVFFIESSNNDYVKVSIIGNEYNLPHAPKIKRVRKIRKEDFDILIKKNVLNEMTPDRLAKYFLLGGDYED